MAATHFAGPVHSAEGFIDNGSNVLTGADAVAITATAAEIDVTAGVTPGTAAPNKALVLGASSEIASITSATIGTMTGNVVGDLEGEVTVTSETLTGAGAISVVTSHTSLVTTGPDALTLAAPTKPGQLKVIVMETDGGDGTLASTNIVGQSVGSTSITFNDAGDALVLVALDTSKWCVIKEFGVTAA